MTVSIFDALALGVDSLKEAAGLTVAELRDRGLTLDVSDMLSRMPRGFEDLAASPVAPAIKLKSFIVRRPVTDAEAQSPGVVDAIVGLAADALPLLQFGWAAVDEARTA